MLHRQVTFWKASLFLLLITAVLFSFVLFQGKSNHKAQQLFVMSAPMLLTLDNQTFRDEASFERATMLTSSTFNLVSDIRHFNIAPTSLAAEFRPSMFSPNHLYLSQGYNLIQISLHQGADEVFSFAENLKSPIQALSFHPSEQKKMIALCENRQLWEIDLSSKRPRLTSLGTTHAIPSDLTIEEMWPNSHEKYLTVSLSSSEDTLLIDISPLNWNLSTNEIVVPRMKLNGGFYVSKHLQVVIDTSYHLHIIDSLKKQIIGSYHPNPDFKFLAPYKTRPLGLVSAGSHLYLADSQSNIIKLGWTANPNAIILNRDIEIKNGNIVLHWKTPKKTDQALYFAELSMIARKPASEKMKNLIFPPEKQFPLKPSKEDSLSLPFFETADRQFDISLFSIHAKSGKLMSPAITFTVDTERKSLHETY